MKRLPYLLLLTALLFTQLAHAQLKPGFNRDEYIDMLNVSFLQFDSNVTPKDVPDNFKFLYRSPVVGFDNGWDLYMRNDKVAVISINGSRATAISWIGNFYAAMVPATGQIPLINGGYFKYKLAENPRAAVHVGWLTGMAYLVQDILPKIDSLYKNGTRNFIITGHSQGGAICYLLTSYLYYLQKDKALPADVNFKTYCSAAPKPGNIYYAYDYENLTQNGLAYNVINTADWVPQTPITIQSLTDFNKTSPFYQAKQLLKKQKPGRRIILGFLYTQLNKPTKKAVKRYKNYLGNLLGKIMSKQIKGYQKPDFYKSMEYVRTGNTITMYADAYYYAKFPDSDTDVFVHHVPQAYLYLAAKLPK